MNPTNDQPKTGQPTDRRVSVAEAAVLLGDSAGAIRSRLKRGTLRKEKAKDGTVLVFLGAGGSGGRLTNGRGRPTTSQPTDQNDVVAVLREQLSFLREQLEQEREANRENRRIIAGLVQRVPELQAAPEPREAPVTPSEAAGKGTTPEQQNLSQRRSWWREFFGLG